MEDDGGPSTRADKNGTMVQILDVMRKHSIYFAPLEYEIRDTIDKSTVPGDAHDLAFREIFLLWRNYRCVMRLIIGKEKFSRTPREKCRLS